MSDPSEFAAISTEKSWYIGDYMTAVLLGADISLFFQSTYYLAYGPYSRRKKVFFIAYTGPLLILMGIADSTNQVEAYLFAHFSGWVDVLCIAAIMVANFMGDALLLYRCYVLLPHKTMFLLLPVFIIHCVKYPFMPALALLTLIKSALPNATLFSGRAETFGVPWVALAVTFNVIVTSLICGRILTAYFSMKRNGVNVVFGVIFAALDGAGNQTVLAFADVWGNIVGLSPQLIILRVAMGHAWTKKTISSGSEPMQFKTGGRTTEVLSETDMDSPGQIIGKRLDPSLQGGDLTSDLIVRAPV